MIVYRLWDPVEGKFYGRCIEGGWASPESWYTDDARSIWLKLPHAEYSLSIAPPDIKDRLVIRAYELVEIDSMGETKPL